MKILIPSACALLMAGFAGLSAGTSPPVAPTTTLQQSDFSPGWGPFYHT